MTHLAGWEDAADPANEVNQNQRCKGKTDPVSEECGMDAAGKWHDHLRRRSQKCYLDSSNRMMTELGIMTSEKKLKRSP